MSITAKVKVQSREEFAGGAAKINIAADYSDGRNKEWASATPQLNLTMVVTENIAPRFKPGTAFTLTFDED